MGGYDPQRGMTRECHILNNTLFENDTNEDGNGEIHLQFDVADCIIRNNLMKTNGQGLLFGNPYTQNSGNDVDYQLFFAPSGAQEWQWRDIYYTALAAYRSASGNDANSLLSAPAFSDAAAYDFRLASGSPARNAGDPARAIAPGETDLHGAARLGEARIDHGAYEYQAGPSGATLAVTGKGQSVGSGDDRPDAADGTELGEVNWREGSLVAEFVVTNSGTEIFRPSRFALESPGSGAFRFARLFASLPAGESRIVIVTFDPASAGSLEAELVIYGAQSAGNTYRFSLRGTGVSPGQLPDQQAGLSPSRLIGNDLYNTTAIGQTAALTMRKKRAVCAFLTENDGALADTIRVTGTRGNRLLKVSYYRLLASGRLQVTGAIFSGTEQLSLASAAGGNYECRLAKSRRALRKKIRSFISLTAQSIHLPGSRDRAAVRVTGR
jgi:hypothetical protein